LPVGKESEVCGATRADIVSADPSAEIMSIAFTEAGSGSAETTVGKELLLHKASESEIVAAAAP